jgi:hypothetical protein
MESCVLIFVTVILHTTMRLHEVQGQDRAVPSDETMELGIQGGHQLSWHPPPCIAIDPACVRCFLMSSCCRRRSRRLVVKQNPRQCAPGSCLAVVGTGPPSLTALNAIPGLHAAKESSFGLLRHAASIVCRRERVRTRPLLKSLASSCTSRPYFLWLLFIKNSAPDVSMSAAVSSSVVLAPVAAPTPRPCPARPAPECTQRSPPADFSTSSYVRNFEVPPIPTCVRLGYDVRFDDVDQRHLGISPN